MTGTEANLSPTERCDKRPETVAWIGSRGTVVCNERLILADYPDERFGVGCAMCLKSLPECGCNV